MKTKIKNGKEYIFDIVRKIYVQNKPEEWVRQHIIQYLNQKKGYPISLMSIEKKNEINSVKKRCDIICNDNNGIPLLLIECKAGHVKLDDKTLNQSLVYQKKINAKLIVLTNGKKPFCLIQNGQKITFLESIPSYNEIIKY